MKLSAKTNIKYGANKDKDGKDREPEVARAGDTFDAPDDIAKQLIDSGAAEPAAKSEPKAKDKD